MFEFFDSFADAFQFCLEVALVFLKPLNLLFLRQESSSMTHVFQHLPIAVGSSGAVKASPELDASATEAIGHAQQLIQ